MTIQDCQLKSECKSCGAEGITIYDGLMIRARRNELGLSLGDVEKATGISKTYISDLEIGNRPFYGNSDQQKRYLEFLWPGEGITD